MDKILLVGHTDWFGTLVETASHLIPDLYVTSNFEEVNARVKLGEIERICMILSVRNPETSASKAAKMLHEINPGIQIMIWNDYEVDAPVRLGNQLYLDCMMYKTWTFYQIMIEFFKGAFPPPSSI